MDQSNGCTRAGREILSLSSTGFLCLPLPGQPPSPPPWRIGLVLGAGPLHRVGRPGIGESALDVLFRAWRRVLGLGEEPSARENRRFRWRPAKSMRVGAFTVRQVRQRWGVYVLACV